METEHPDSEPIPVSSPCLQGERVAFTGTLASMTHQQARIMVQEHGGVAAQHISRNITMLVVGEEGWPLEFDALPSQKLQQAILSHCDGMDVRVLRESEWLTLLGLDDLTDQIQRTYTPTMLSTLLDIPVTLIRRWERRGLIKPVRRVGRLSYFSFAEVTSARRLSELMQNGVTVGDIEASLKRLSSLAGGIDRPLSQLQVLASDARVVYRDDVGLIQAATGQRLLDFEIVPDPEPLACAGDADSSADDKPSALRFPGVASSEVSGIDDVRVQWTSAEWFVHACQLTDDDRLDDAIEACRLCLTANGGLCAEEQGESQDILPIAGQPAGQHHRHSGEQPHPAEVNFHLADALYRSGRIDSAIERYYVAVEHDLNYLEAWTQLGCLLSETDRNQPALEAFEIALDIHPDYPDAHFHVANLLEKLGRHEEARNHWTRYLDFDSRGPWAENARQKLGDHDTSG